MSQGPARRPLAYAPAANPCRKRDDAKWKTTFSYVQPQPGLLHLEGTLDGWRIRARLHLEKPPRFLLTIRGFHWINERPLNR